MTKEQLLERVRAIGDTECPLAMARFCSLAGIKRNVVEKHFDSWADACAEAGLRPAPRGKANLRINPAIAGAECIAELKRIAAIVGRNYITLKEFNTHARFSKRPLVRNFGSFTAALAHAGLESSPNRFEETPFATLAGEFERIVGEVGRIPSIRQLVRRTARGDYCFKTKYGGYDEFKRKAIASLLARADQIEPKTRSLLEGEFSRIGPTASLHAAEPAAHLHGRSLRFRAFAFAPTYENEVVAIFGAVAHELGFEIIANRPAFPDCEAQRRIDGPRERFKRCLIEFELRSKDFLRHGHKVDGCDLIICWEHDWANCPVEVLELSRAIRGLPGWR